MTKEQFDSWKSRPETRIILKTFAKERELQTLEACQLGILGSTEEIALGVARKCGYCMGLTELADINWQSYKGMVDSHKEAQSNEEDD